MSADLRSRLVILGCARAQRSSISFWAPLASRSDSISPRFVRRSLKLWFSAAFCYISKIPKHVSKTKYFETKIAETFHTPKSIKIQYCFQHHYIFQSHLQIIFYFLPSSFFRKASEFHAFSTSWSSVRLKGSLGIFTEALLEMNSVKFLKFKVFVQVFNRKYDFSNRIGWLFY